METYKSRTSFPPEFRTNWEKSVFMYFWPFATHLRSCCLVHLYNCELDFSVLRMFQVLFLSQTKGWQRFSIVLPTVSSVYQLSLQCIFLSWCNTIFSTLLFIPGPFKVLFRKALTMPRPFKWYPYFLQEFQSLWSSFKAFDAFYEQDEWYI